jgi:predicted aldo/keto reductase-like oxidoreductase
MVLFGEVAAEPFIALDDILESIEIYAIALAANYRYVAEHPDVQTPKDAAQNMEELKNKLFRLGSVDSMKPAIDKMIAQVIAICPSEIRKGLAPKSWWKRFTSQDS